MSEDLTADAARAMRRYDEVVRHGREIRRRRRTRNSVLAVIAAAGVTAVIAGSLALTRGAGTARVRTTSGDEHATQPSLDPRPAWVTGQEQHIVATPIPAWATGVLDPRRTQWTPVNGTLHAFSVDGSPPAVIFDATPSSSSPLPAGNKDVSVVGMYDQDNPAAESAGGGFGILSGSNPLADIESGTRNPVFLAPHWPQVGLQAYAWPHLPTGTAIVTYSWQTMQLWERPLDNLAGFVMPRPAQFDGPMYSDWHSAPLPVLRAYDANGKLLAQVNAPRMNGDDFIVSRG